MRRADGTAGLVYIAHIVPGLKQVTQEELQTELPGVTVLRVLQRIDERTDLVIFRAAHPPGSLLDLRTVEDVFILAAESDAIPAGRAGLATIRGTIARSTMLQPAVDAAFSVRAHKKGRPTFRVIARKAGDHAFRRVDVQRAAELAVLDRFSAWRLVDDDSQLELWVQLFGSLLLAGVRLSDSTLRQRTYRQANLPAALKPTIAAAMVLLSEPSPDDIFLDPMCGSGTILIERALAGRYRQLMGGDSDPTAVNATRENVGRRYQPIGIRQWNARNLPLDDASVTCIVTNLPFGKQIGSAEGNRSLYPALLAEWMRVVSAGGRIVLLTSERVLLRQCVQRLPELELRRELPILVRGMRAFIVVLDRQTLHPPGTAAQQA